MKISKRGLSPLLVSSSVIILFILLPTILLLTELINPANETWDHIRTYLLKEYIYNSLVIVLAVGIITSVLGTFFSWFLTQYNFKYSNVLSSLLLLPLAIPPYIAGYIYGGIFGYFGTLERILRAVNINPVRIDVFSIGGAIFVFTLFLMPYVIIATRVFFYKMPASYIESARILGKTPWQVFYKVVLPMSRGAIIGGVVLVALEVLNDYGLVKYFGINTFSTAIYTTWFGLGDLQSAIRLAAILMVIVFTILSIEYVMRGKGRISQARALVKSANKKNPSKSVKILFFSLYSIYIVFSVIVPITQLIFWSLLANKVVIKDLIELIFNTLLLAGSVTIIIIISGILIGNFGRFNKSAISKFYSRVVILGYSVPAAIIAVAILVFFLDLDSILKPIYDLLRLKGLLLTSSIVMLIFALSIRFMAIGYNNLESGFNKMGLKYYEASKLLGKGEWKTFLRIDLPMLKPAIIGASVLIFVDVLKELPLTLILRPFNFDSLATKVFTYAGDEMIHEASVYSLMIIFVSIGALVFMNRLQKEIKND